MNNSEEFGVKISLIIDKFKQKANEITGRADKLSKDLTNKLNVKPKIDTNSLLQKINKLKSDFESLSKTDQKQMAIDLGYGDVNNAKQAIEDLEYEVEQAKKVLDYSLKYPAWANWNSDTIKNAKKTLEECKIAVDNLSNSFNRLSNSSNKGFKAINFNSISKGVDRATNKIKRFALSLLSIRSIYALLSRASSAYLATDQERADKLQSVWAGLGATLTPVIDMITSALQKLVGYINVFVAALTGTNYIAKASANYMNSLAKSAKATAKSLAGFDEINNIGNTGNDNTSTNPFSAFKNVKLDESIVQKLQGLAETLKDNWEWIKLVGEMLAVTFGIAKIGGWISNIGNLNSSLGLGTGLLGTLQSLIGIGAIAITVTLVGNYLKEKNELHDWIIKTRELNAKNYEEWLGNEAELSDIYTNNKNKAEGALDAIKKASTPWAKLLGYSSLYLETADTAVMYLGLGVKEVKKRVENEKLSVGEQENILTELSDEYTMLKKIEERMKIQGGDISLISEVAGDYKTTMQGIIEDLHDQGIEYDDIYKKLGLTETEINDIYGICKKPAEIKVSLNTTQADKDYSNWVTKAGNGVTTWIGDTFKKIGNKITTKFATFWSGNSFDVGTNYVPNDQLALVHKGEAIVPKKFNSSEYFNQSNSDVVSKLDQLIDTLENKDMNAYISRDAVGKASKDYINEKTRQLGKAVV